MLRTITSKILKKFYARLVETVKLLRIDRKYKFQKLFHATARINFLAARIVLEGNSTDKIISRGYYMCATLCMHIY